MLQGFKQFILRGNVVDLAVGVVIGGAFGAVVNSLVADIMTPLISAIFHAPDFSGLFFTINESKFMYGNFFNALISFIIVASSIYFFVVTPLNKLMLYSKKSENPIEPTTKKCPECISEIPKEARRCAHCATPVDQH
ncbi:MAG: large conductance mechanosensitive channel protein MscL [Candidatus Zambryskibacteria bacterium]|nr:large conductance mechanosensitive channel protein MscL [Candidatus Zambryskibacteria bacterium]